MATRRSKATIAEVQEIHDRTQRIADKINDDIGLDATPIVIRASSYWHARADRQRSIADDIVISVTTKDPVEAEKYAAALKLVWQGAL